MQPRVIRFNGTPSEGNYGLSVGFFSDGRTENESVEKDDPVWFTGNTSSHLATTRAASRTAADSEIPVILTVSVVPVAGKLPEVFFDLRECSEGPLLWNESF